MNVCNEAMGCSTTVTFKANCSSEKDVIGSQRSTVLESNIFIRLKVCGLFFV